MCTLIILKRVLRDAPVVIAANRDEYPTRRSTPPRVLHEVPRAVGGFDIRSNGSWLGATRSGSIVALTNQRTGNFPFSSPASRGQLVLECLTSEHVREQLESIQPRDYNEFNLLFGDARELSVAYVRRDRVEIASVPEGIHVLPNDQLDSSRFAKVTRARSLLASIEGQTLETALSSLIATLSDHVRPPLHRVPPRPTGTLMPRIWTRQLDSLCVHAWIYGTRSSSIVALNESGVVRYLFAEGPPCTTSFRDFTDLVA